MNTSSLLNSARASIRSVIRDYDVVQAEGALESLRRFIVTLWFFVPLEAALALWFGFHEVDNATVENQRWASSLFVVHATTALVTTMLAFLVRRLLRSSDIHQHGAVVIQVALCLVYLAYGVAISVIDLSVGNGISSFLLVTVGIGGLSLMRPGVSVPMFALALFAFWQVVPLANPNETMLTSLRINSLSASILAIALSVITWRLYARGILLRKDLSSKNLALQDTQQELEQLAWNDPLTGLPNRRFLLERLREALANSARSGREGALLLIDLDNFKILNDTRGHDVGDLLLQSVARRITASLRAGDTVARLGGDEFVVMLENVDSTNHDAARQAEAVADKILQTLGQPHQLGTFEHRTTPSIGIAMFSEHEQTVDELLKRADMAMYQAKAGGRNAVRFYDHEIQARVDTKLALEAGLRTAINNGELRLFYQALVDCDGRVLGTEALVRWQHPQRGMVSPIEFIPIAEETGLILPLGEWVLETACKQLAAWAQQPEYAALTISVNVSVKQFVQDSFVADVLQVIRRTGAPPGRLKLELTESLLATNLDGIVSKMTMLGEAGVQFSLDDFGTGYSSLSYLRRLPFHVLKIDQSFVRDVLADHTAKAIATTIIALAKQLGMEIVAEGIETKAQRDFLVTAGCPVFQGYLFGRPGPVELVEASMNADMNAVGTTAADE